MKQGIQTKAELKRILKLEKDLYIEKEGSRAKFMKSLTKDVSRVIYQYVCLLRKTEYHHNQKGIGHELLYAWYRRRKNKLGMKLGFEIWDNTFEEGLTICHAGDIVVNGLAHIGKNCKLHGMNCIGNDGKTAPAPIIGDDVRLGVAQRCLAGCGSQTMSRSRREPL